MTQPVTVRPSREEFHALATDYTVVPVWVEVLADLETPVAAFAKLVGDEPGFLLESVEHGERWSRFSFVGRHPRATLELIDGQLKITGDIPASVPRDQGMLAAIEALLLEYRSPVIADLPPLQGGVMGFLGYDVVREVESLPFRSRLAGVRLLLSTRIRLDRKYFAGSGLRYQIRFGFKQFFAAASR